MSNLQVLTPGYAENRTAKKNGAPPQNTTYRTNGFHDDQPPVSESDEQYITPHKGRGGYGRGGG